MSVDSAVKIRPIIFSGPMVRAIIGGRKTQTRRIIKLSTTNADRSWRLDCHDVGAAIFTRPNRVVMGHEVVTECVKIECPYGQPDDRLWVRETWAVDADIAQARREHEDMMPGLRHGPYFRADPVHENSGLIWRPAIHMPRWASRITLEVTGVRVERLQDISENDAKAEGINWSYDRDPFASGPSACRYGNSALPGRGFNTAKFAFENLWDSINAKRAPWSSNPWVWVIEFRLLP